MHRLDLWHARTLRVGELTPALHWRLSAAIASLAAPGLTPLDEPTRELDDAEFGGLMEVLAVTAEDLIVIIGGTRVS